MKIGFCTGMAAQDEWRVGYARIPQLAQMGYDYVEMPLAQVTAMPETAFVENVLKTLADTQMACIACNNFFPAQIRLVGDGFDANALREYLAKAFDRASRMGVQTIVLGSSGARNLSDGITLAEGYAQLSEALAVIAPMAQACGITIALEPLNRLESNILNTYEEGLWVSEKSGEKNVKCLADSYHMRLGGETLETFMRCQPAHVHYARTLGRRLPEMAIAEDVTFFTALKAAGYDGAVSLEGNPGNDFEGAAKKALTVLRHLANAS